MRFSSRTILASALSVFLSTAYAQTSVPDSTTYPSSSTINPMQTPAQTTQPAAGMTQPAPSSLTPDTTQMPSQTAHSSPSNGLKNLVIFTPDTLKWQEGPKMIPPGVQYAVLEGNIKSKGPVTVRLKVPANYQMPPVYSPTAKRVTILSGTMNVGLGDKFDNTTGMALPAGSFVVMPAFKHHYIWASEDSVVQVTGIGPLMVKYVNPKDDPRNQAHTTH